MSTQASKKVCLKFKHKMYVAAFGYVVLVSAYYAAAARRLYIQQTGWLSMITRIRVRRSRNTFCCEYGSFANKTEIVLSLASPIWMQISSLPALEQLAEMDYRPTKLWFH